MTDQMHITTSSSAGPAGTDWPGPENPVRAGQMLRPFTAELSPPRAHELGPDQVHDISIAETTISIHPDLPALPAWGFGLGGEITSPGPLLEAAAGQSALVRWSNRLPGSVRPGQKPPARLPIDTVILPQDPKAATDSVQNYLGSQPCPGTPAGTAEDLSGAPVGWTTIHLHGAHTPSAADGWPDDMAPTGTEQLAEYPNDYDNADLGLAKAGEFLWYHDHAMNGTRYHNYSGLAGPYLLRDPRERQLGLPASADDGEIVLVIQDRNVNAEPGGQLRLLHKITTDTGEAFSPLTLVNGKLWPRLSLRPDVYRLRLLNASNARTYQLHLVSARKNPGGTVTVTPQHHRMLVIGADGGLLWRAWQLADEKGLILASAERFDVLVDLTGVADGEQLMLVNSAEAPFGGAQPADLPKLLAHGDRPGRNPFPWVMRFDIDTASPHRGAPRQLYVDTSRAVLNPAFRRLVPDPGNGGMGGMAAAPEVPSPRAGGTGPAAPGAEPEAMPVTNPDITTVLLGENPPGHLFLQQLVPDSHGKIKMRLPGEKRERKYRVVQWAADDKAKSDTRVSFYDRVALRPVIGAWQVFRFINTTGDTHPMHVHLSQFQPLGAAGTGVLKTSDGHPDSPNYYDPETRETSKDLKPDPGLTPRPFDPAETQGWKDVIRIDPGNVVEVAGRFDLPGRYVYHCHILEHEDTEMMQPIIVTVADMKDGQPMPM
ncbi:MAG: multicopper oxidase domain-containing protein [Streptosporangiales bacterium]|nr:multicopper oxidase domain-containing protein [Streptosporangiales bacterium]